jgi:hypothetical protein
MKQIIENRFCKNCGGNEFYISSKEVACVECHKTANKKFLIKKRKNPDFIIKFNKDRKKYYDEHTEILRKASRDSLKKAKLLLNDSFIKSHICNYLYNVHKTKIKSNEISQEDIKKVRKVLTIKRELRNENKKTT